MSQAHRNSEMNIRGAIETMKNGRELIDDEFISPKNRVEALGMNDLDVSGGKSMGHNPASQHVTENLLKHIDSNLQNQLKNSSRQKTSTSAT